MTVENSSVFIITAMFAFFWPHRLVPFAFPAFFLLSPYSSSILNHLFVELHSAGMELGVLFQRAQLHELADHRSDPACHQLCRRLRVDHFRTHTARGDLPPHPRGALPNVHLGAHQLHSNDSPHYLYLTHREDPPAVMIWFSLFRYQQNVALPRLLRPTTLSRPVPLLGRHRL